MKAPLYYEGDLENKFNYHWLGLRWVEFCRLVNLGVKPARIRDQCYTLHPKYKTRIPMSREAYFRWSRSLKRAQERAKLKIKEGQANATEQ